MPVIIDGNNLLHSLPSDERDRRSVRQKALDAVRHEGMSLTVVFDGPPPAGSPETEHLGRVTIRYSGRSSADELILRLLPSEGRASNWVVVSDDRALGKRVRDRGASVRTLKEWRSRRSRKPVRTTREPKLSSHEVADWEEYFSSDTVDKDLEP
jgi:predicted RNA-binding protein with PIN domain